MKKPLLVILIIGFIPIVLLAIGLSFSHNDLSTSDPLDNIDLNNSDNVITPEKDSRGVIERFFSYTSGNFLSERSKTISLFKNQTLDQLQYSNDFKNMSTLFCKL